MKKKLLKIFYPNKFIAIPLCILSAILLIYVFSFHLESHYISYIAYLLSTYSLILFIIWFCKACQFSNNLIKNTNIYKIYKKNYHTILKVNLVLSSAINLVYGIFKLITGIYYKSWWFITFAVYYLFLWLMKLLLIKDTKIFGENINQEYKKMKNTGLILFLLNIVLFGMILLIISQNQYFTYPGYLIYGIALYDFYLIITAIINVFKYNNNKSPIIISSKCISLMVAMISILSLEVSMIYKFGDNDPKFRIIMIFITGIVIAVINSVVALRLIFKSKKNNLSRYK